MAYVIYTSGTTGRPKAAMLQHFNISNFLVAFNQPFDEDINSDDIVLSLANYVFDASVCDFFVTLTSGATLVIYNKYTTYDPTEIAKAIVDHKITYTFIPPSLLDNVASELKRSVNEGSCVNLQKLSVGVESIRGKTLAKFYELNEDIQIVNGYGPQKLQYAQLFTE